MKKIYLKLFLAVLLLSNMQMKAQSVAFDVSYDSYLCAPVEVILNNYSDLFPYEGVVNYKWFINDSLVSTFQYPSPIFLEGGWHFMRLEAYDSTGFNFLGIAEQQIYIKGFSGRFHTFPENEATINQPVTFSTDNNPYWVVWKLHDGTVLNYNGAQHIYPTEGVFPAKMTISGECGMDSVTQWITITNSAVPETYINLSNFEVCPNDEFILNASPAYKNEWIIEGDTILGKEIYYAFADTGIHKIILRNQNMYGNYGYDSVFVKVLNNRYVNASFTYNFQSGPCPNNQIIFEAYESGTFEWDFGDGSTGFGKRVYNTFVDTGMYEVKLYATNGCGTQDTSSQPIFIQYGEFSGIPYADFIFKNRDNNFVTAKSDITICPNELVEMVISSYQDESIYYTWLINGEEFTQDEVSYIFTSPGDYEILLTARNNCNSESTMSKWVFVDSTMYPEASLNFAPKVICPGEYVYFFDDQADYKKDGLSYYVDFGDGQNSGIVTKPVDELTRSLAVHQYATEGVYHFTMTATNKCGNSITFEDSVIVNNDPTRIPFYYIHNTSTSDDMESEFEDWSVKPNRQYTTFNVNIDLVEWNYYCLNMDSIVNVFFWYGAITDINDPNLGPPNGYVQVKAPGIATAYIPFNVVKPSVGMIVAWYCNKDYFDEWPKVYTQPVDSNFMPIPSFPTIPGTTFDLPQTIDLFGSQWTDCVCAPPTDKLRGTWSYQVEEGYFNILDIWDENDTLRYRASASPDQWGWQGKTDLTSGNLLMTNDSSVQLMQDIACFQEPGMYNFDIVNDNELTFAFIYDNCMPRADFLTPDVFLKNENDNVENNQVTSGCPGDTIGFYIVGGEFYEWHIQGTVTEGPEAFYVYDTVGTYEEFVVTRNACNRYDTIYTKAIIGENNIPDAEFGMDKWDAKRFEPINFYANIWDDFENYTILWEFGDGISSTEKNPTHFYIAEGEYTITLRIENGCGYDIEQKTIWIAKETTVCEAKFVYTSTTGTTVNFEDKSLGKITSYFWEFGDGKVSTKANPVNIYPAEGIYMVTLTVYDSLTNCSNQIKKQITVGTISCLANYNFTVNNINRTVSFNNLSTGDIYYWKFGDNMFSSEINPSHVYANEGTYKVCLVAKDTSTNCMSEICKNVTIGNPGIIADFNYYIDPQSGIVSFSDISTGTVTNWYWEFGDGMWDTIPQTQHVYYESGEYDVCLSVFNYINNDFANVCKTISVITDTSAVSTRADFTYMVDSAYTVDFINKSSGEITNWYWTFGDGSFLPGEDVSHTYSAPGLYNVCLTVYSSATNERSEFCQTIQVGVISCNINAEFGYFINPQTKQVTFSDKTTGTAHKWFWDFGNGKTSSQKNPIHTYENSGFYLVSLAVRDTINGCTDYFADFLQIGTADCKADFNFTITDIATNKVKFTDKSFGNIGRYFWYFNDGNFSTEKDPINTYSSGGLYSVSLTVTDNSGLCMDYISKDVQVGTIDCNADFTFYIDSMSNEVYFSNQTVAAGTSLYWLFGDGTYWIGESPMHTYTAPGYYNVSLNTFNPNNGCMDYEQKVLLIGSPGNDVNADFIYSADLTTRIVKFSNQSNGQNLTYIWNLGDGNTSTLSDPEYTYTTGGYKFVCLTARNTVTGMQNTTCKLIQVSSDEESNCLARFNYDVDTSTLNVKFIDKSYGAPNQFFWDFGDSTSSTSQDPTKTYNNAGYYLVGLKTKNASGCESFEYEIVNVNAGTGIQAMFAYIVDTTEGRKPGGKPVDMIGVGHGGGSQLGWNFGDGTTKSGSVDSTTLRPTHLYENPGLYEACLIISDPIINQSDTFCNNIPIPYETTAAEAICEGTSYNFFGNELTVAGEYLDTTTSVIGVDSIVYLTLTVNPAPAKPTATLAGTTVTSSTATSYQWYKDGTIISGATNQSYIATVSGNYTVVVTNTFGCYSDPSEPVSVVISGIEDINPFSLKVFPNPMQSHTRIEYYLTNTQQINITLYDVAGNSIETIVNTYKPAGDHYIVWRNPGLANGIYYLVMTSNNEKSTTKLVIQK